MLNDLLGAWQPIETAPKDGTTVLLWDGEVQIGEWSENVHPWNNGDWWIAGGQVTTKTAKHWMPLPEAPNVQGEPLPTTDKE